LFVQATEAWDALRLVAPADAPESQVAREAHFVVVYSIAAGAGAKAEAKRLYPMLGEDYRRVLDENEDREPGRWKIWLAK
jgi:hypothetical protein